MGFVAVAASMGSCRHTTNLEKAFRVSVVHSLICLGFLLRWDVLRGEGVARPNRADVKEDGESRFAFCCGDADDVADDEELSSL